MSRPLIAALLAAMVGLGAYAQIPTPSVSPKLTTATCGKSVCTWTPYANSYTRQAGQPETISNNFSVLNPNTQFTLHIDNNGVSSAVVSINGAQVLGPSDFDPNTTSLDRASTLNTNNTLQVQLRGKPGTSFALAVIGVDNDPPSISETATPRANSFGWNNTNVNIAFACSDSTSGIASCPNAVSVTTEGLNQLVAGTAFDLAGNSSTASLQVSIDKTPPTILPSQNPPVNSFGWNNSSVTVSFLCNDNLSGVQICTPPVLVSTEGPNQTVIGMAMDFAGNSGTASTAVSIDLTPPTIMATSSPAANANGWNNTPVTVSFSCTDVLSGVALCPPPQTVSSEGANQNISGTAFDKAGNNATANISLNIDETAPSLSINSPATSSTVTSASLQVSGTVSDTLSGVALVTCNGTAAAVSSGSFSCNLSLRAGANNIQVQATDNAGNTASSQIAVTFNATPLPPPKSLLITPSLANMVVGGMQPVALIGNIGQPVSGATWSISDPTIVSITSADPPQLTALTQGTATLTATFNGLTATMTVNVLPGAALAAGTPIWSSDPLPGDRAFQIVPASPVNPGDPDIYVLESPNIVRAFAAEGRQLWSTQIGPPPQTSSAAAANLIATATQDSVSNPSSLSPTLPMLPVRRVDPFRTAMEKRLLLASQRPSTTLQTTQTAPLRTSAEQAIASAATTSTTFVGRSVPDQNGGTINWITTIPSPGANPQDSLVRLDSQGAVTWRFDDPGLLDPNFAVSDDGTIYITESVQTGKGTDIFSFAPQNTQTNLLAFDAATGQQKFSKPLPSGHLFWQFIDQLGQPPRIAVDLEIGAIVGPVSVLPDGSAQVVMETIQTSQTNTRPFAVPAGFVPGICPSLAECETSASVHKTLELMQVQPDGTLAPRTMTTSAFDNPNCFGNCGGPNGGAEWAGVLPDFEPGEVIPDGQGGALAEWFDPSFRTDGTNALTGTNLVDFLASGGNSQFSLPLRPGGNFGDPATTLVLGDMGTAFANDGLTIVAFDSGSGATQWSFNPGTDVFATIAATGDGGLMLFGRAGEIVALDASGNVTADTTSLNFSTVTYSDSNNLLAIATGGQIQAASFSNVGVGNVIWPLPDGNQQKKRAPARLEITKVARNRAMVGTTINLFVRGTLFGQSPKLIFGDPENPRTDLMIDNDSFRYDNTTGVITADIKVAANAVGGKVLIFVQSGKQTSAPNNDAFFFVQIPTTVAGTAFPGQFDTIPATGAGPLHLPNFGPNDFVFDASGAKVDVKDTTPVCGVYRNFAFQLYDQDQPGKDQPGKPIEAAVQVTENLSDGTSVNSSTNTSGMILDTHAAVKPKSCLQDNEFRDLMQAFVVSVGDQTFKLTTIFHIIVGNVNGTLTEKTEIVHQ